MSKQETPPVFGSGMGRTLTAVLAVFAVWAGASWLFWIGYVGADDIFYARYAHLLHRPPFIWWEFRMPLIMAVRASFTLCGPNEMAACIPNLTASLLLMASTAWIAGWPRRLTWQSNLTMILASMLPLDLAFRSSPSATYFANALCGVGTAFWLRGGRPMQYLGSAVFAIAFASHEIMMFYIGIFCGLALLFDWKRFIQPVLALGALVTLTFVAEGIAYQNLLGDPLARYRVASSGAGVSIAGADSDAGISGLRFYLWPIEIVLASKHFAGSLLLFFSAGLLAWRKFSQDQRLLFLTVAFTWAWLGWGTMIPWAYKPFFRQFHYLPSILLGLNTLMPASVFLVFRPLVARWILIMMVCLYFLASAAGGRWGENFEASRALLEYANSHSSTNFVTDVSTMNQMYAIRGFTLPPNVICLNGPAVRQHLLLNKEPASQSQFAFKQTQPAAILYNMEGPWLYPFEVEFLEYIKEHPGRHETVLPMRRKWLFQYIPGLKDRPVSIRNLGAEAIYLNP